MTGMKRLVLSVLLTIVLNACVAQSSSIVGTWYNEEQGGYLVFGRNGQFDMQDVDGVSVTPEGGISTYESISEVVPHQLYVRFEIDGNSERIPLGIYKIENGKLIMRDAIEIHRSLGGFDMGVTRYEMPSDFSGVLRVFERRR